MSLQELSLKAVPHPREQARKFLPPWHTVRIALEEREFNERIDRFREEHKLRFWYILIELRVLEDLNLTLPLYPSRVWWLQQSELKAWTVLCLERRLWT